MAVGEPDDEGEERELKTLTVKLGSAGREINTDELYKAVLTAYADANFEMQYVVEEDLPEAFDLDALYHKYYVAPVNAVCNEDTYEVTDGSDGYGFDIKKAMDELENAKGADPEYVPLPKFPAVTRDIAVVCDKAVTVGELEDAILKGAKGLLKDMALFDIYTGVGIATGKKSVAFNLTLRADDRSLTAEEADADVKSILTALEQECGAVLR